jgi:uncharacterized membrane protein
MKTKDFVKREWVFWILILAPAVFALYHWPEIPDKVPTHWNASGEVDSYGGRWAAFLSPMISLATYFLLLLIPKIDPRKKNYDLFGGAYWMIRIALTILFSVIGFVTILAALGVVLNVGLIIMLSILSLFIVIGNQFGRVRPNYFVGIRTPWTISNEEVWMKTHRLGGRIWVIASAVMIPLVFLIPAYLMAYIFIAYVLAIAAVPIIYSYIIYKRITEK